MTAIPWQSLNQALFQRAQHLLDEHWITKDPQLAPVLPVVMERGVGQDWHKAGTFKHHLYGVARSLALWQQPHDVQLLGLLHSVYGNAFVDLVKFDARSERSRLQALVGVEVEHLVHLFCTMSRSQFINKVLERDFDDDGGMMLELNGPEPRTSVRLTPREVASNNIKSMADTIEQWFSWQEEIYSRSPNVDTSRKQSVHWAASLWPGPMRPPSRKICQLSQLGLALEHPGLKDQLPIPPVFNFCTEGVTKENDAAATSLYWSVIQLDQPLVDLDVVTAVLEQAVRLNPWVGEPQMVLAQVYLSAGRQDDAVRAAQSALQCFSAWGNAWDKRVQWDAWVSWTRILLQSAQEGTWPERLDKLNNLALRT